MIYRLVISLPLILIISACSNTLNLQVDTNVPTPIASQLPLDLGIYYNENFRNFVFKETSTSREDWVIDNRAARLSLFNEILPTMFRTVKPVKSNSATSEPVDLIMEPEVTEMQVALPQETHSDIFEAWIKYHIKMHSPAGELITEWQITGYGKTHTELFKNKERGLTTAITQALRDIGAKLVLDFRKVPEIRNWLITRVDCSQHSALCQ